MGGAYGATHLLINKQNILFKTLFFFQKMLKYSYFILSIARSSNGRTAGFGPVNWGSIPYLAAMEIKTTKVVFLFKTINSYFWKKSSYCVYNLCLENLQKKYRLL